MKVFDIIPELDSIEKTSFVIGELYNTHEPYNTHDLYAGARGATDAPSVGYVEEKSPLLYSVVNE